VKPVAFVQPSEVAGWGVDVQTEPRLGRVERRCAKCAGEWQMDRGECSCGSHELVEKYIEPTLFERGPFGAIRALVIPAKPKAPRATAAQIKALHSLQASATALLVDLRVLDVQLRDAVVNDVDELREAQALMNLSLSITGDASPDRIAHLSLSLTAFAAFLARAIDNLEGSAK
jgi:hypothetical protein